MIWLSTNHGQEHVSYYFSPQSSLFSCSGGVSRGIIKGILGDGVNEVLTEISLGAQESVCFVPLWNEGDGVASFPPPGADRVLELLLLDEIKRRIDIDVIHLSGEPSVDCGLQSPQESNSALAMAA